MRLYFARHGESEANVLGVISNRDLRHPLTALGRQQAEDLAASLAGAGVRRIFSSPVLRARQTAAILAERLGVTSEPVDALREFDCGIAEGRGDPAAWEQWRAAWAAWHERGDYGFCIEGGESFEDLRGRFVPFVERLVEDHRATDGAFVLVSHGGLLCSMLPLVLANAGDRRGMGFPHTAYVLAEPAGGGLRCVSWCGEAL